MQAGLVTSRLAWCDIFSVGGPTVVVVTVVVAVSVTVRLRNLTQPPCRRAYVPSARLEAA